MSIQINGTTGISGVDGSATTPALQGQDTNTGISFGTDEVNVVTGGSTRTTVDSSGRLLVGTTTARNKVYNGTTSSNVPQFQTEVSGSGVISRAMITGNPGTNTSDVGPALILARSAGTADNSYTAVTSTANHLGAVSFQGADGSEFVEAARIEALVDGTPGANNMPGRLAFYTNSGSSAPTERLRITSDGTLQLRNSPGIDFSQIQTNDAGMTSETLDKYEEGTWTPQANNITVASGTPTYSGNYVRVGNIVHVTMQQSGGSITLGSGSNFSGLPYGNDNRSTGWFFCTNSGKKGAGNYLSAGIYLYMDEGQTPSGITALKLSLTYRVP